MTAWWGICLSHAKMFLLPDVPGYSYAHTPDAFIEAGIRTQTVPLRTHRDINQTWVAAFQRTIQMLERHVHLAGFAEPYGQLHGRECFWLPQCSLEEERPDTGNPARGISLFQRFQGRGGSTVQFCMLDGLRHIPVKIALFPVSAGQVLARVRMRRINLQSFVGPLDRVVVAALEKVRYRDLQMHQR